MTINPSEYARVTDDGIYGFFGKYRFLSNFEDSHVLYDQCGYRTVEHAYQAAKTLDYQLRIPFMENGVITASQAKRYGSKLKIRDDWEKVKYDVMLELVFMKFMKHKELREKLLGTGGLYLEETNHWGDNTWGVDYRSDIGKNWLGQILMDVRKCFKSSAMINKPKTTEGWDLTWEKAHPEMGSADPMGN